MFLGDLWQNLLSDLYPGAAVLLLFAFPPHLPPTPRSVMSNALLRYRGVYSTLQLLVTQ